MARWPQRPIHVTIALAIALVTALTTLLEPLDTAIWTAQSNLAQRSASGDIVVVDLPAGLPEQGGRSGAAERLVGLIDQIEAAGADRIFLDLPLEAPGYDPDGLIASAAPNVFFVKPMRDYTDGQPEDTAPISSSDSAHILARVLYLDFVGMVWDVPTSAPISRGRELREFSAVLSGRKDLPERTWIDYTIQTDTIPVISAGTDLRIAADPQADLRGRDVVITNGFAEKALWIKVPGRDPVAPTLISVLAAETLKHGGVIYVVWVFPLLGIALLLFMASLIRQDRIRQGAYGLIVVGLSGSIIASAHIPALVERHGALALLASYALLRMVDRYKQRHLLVDRKSGLPNFAALERDLATDHDGLIVVMQVTNCLLYTSDAADE